ncbi:hypothetical protein SAMN05518672_104774 [Chitinophaga sp. CF118]|uniref:hypothetical protein n=1 Tax=Chitinophaga sp. CF118 TaxID=1884367 RepID=UPI0008E9A986|nr:hypothetical protein [Chitinophaga sp. CF118]SFE17767.1 hypothetical protein SAMN05518672_104774 [Chitinophaga sp. CF118]
MYPDPDSNPLLQFKSTTTLPFIWQQHLLPNSKPTLHTASFCKILVQELYLGNRLLWYFILNVSKDDLLIRLVLPQGLYQLLLYNIQNTGEMIFLHQDTGMGINEKDYCYLGGGFRERDLRVLVSKGCYQTVIFPFSFLQISGMKRAETFAFIEKYLIAMGIPLVN